MDKQLKIIAGSIVTESKLSKQSKLQLLNFIQYEATDIQIKALLLDGKILTKIDKQTEQIIEDRFKNHNIKKIINEINPELMSAGIVGGTMLAIAGKMAFNVSRNILNKAHRACKKFKENEKQKCLSKFRKEAAIKQIQVLQSYRGKCNKTKNPEKCIAGIDKKIAKAKKQTEVIIP
jgi:hypothetical protein